MKDFLLEIGTEPLPSRFVRSAIDQLQTKMSALLQESRLSSKSVRAFGTYRRLAIVVEGLQEKSEPQVREVLGPPARFLKDEKGAFTPQAAGFARAQGIKPEELAVVSSPKGEVLCARKNLPGEPADKILARSLPGLIASLEFPKSMVWEESRFRFARPIRNLLALYGTKPLRLSVAGVRSGRTVRGLPALEGKPIRIPDPSKYAATLKNHCVLVDPEERRVALEKSLDQAGKKLSSNADKDPALMEETVFLAEHPVSVHGQFTPESLRLPAALLSTVLKKQLKFFPVLDKQGRLAPHFVGIRDGISEGQKEVQEGFERVLAARLADALFFFDKDLKTSLDDKRGRLKDIIFQEKLGSLLEKSERIEKLAGALSGILEQAGLKNDRAAVLEIARFAYADLVCEVVREFPELQGLMGGEYAKAQGRSKTVAEGLSDFYLPAGPGTPIPRSLESCIASLAGKLDTLTGQFSIGNIPTGSEDPFALRRQAAGIVRIVVEKALPLDLEEAVSGQLRDSMPAAGKDLARVVLGFLWQRVESLLEEKGYRPDEMQAVQDGGLKDLQTTLKKISALHKTRKVAQFDSLAAAFKRANNILRQADFRDGGRAPDAAKFQQEEERALWDAVARMESEVLGKSRAGEYEAVLTDLVRLKEPLDRFFEKVLVMAEDAGVKDNRLALLAHLVRLLSSVADLSKLQ